MPRPDIAPYVEGDRIQDGRGNVAVVRLCTFRSGRQGLRAFVVEGDLKDAWFWPEKFGKPVIDWAPDGIRKVCVDCERPFLSAPDRFGLMRIKCRTCEGFEQTTVRQMERTADMNDTKHSIRWRQQHKRTSTDEVEDLIAEETRTR